MKPEEFSELAGILPEPMLLVSSRAEILALNRAASQLLEKSKYDLIGKTLSQIASDSEEQITRYLQNCSKSRQFVIGALALRQPDGNLLQFRSEGAVFHPAENETPARILLRLKPKESAGSQFTVLSQKIKELNKEIHDRKRAESALKESEQHFRLLAEISHELTSSLDYELILKRVGDLIVPALADVCYFDLFTGKQKIKKIAARQSQPAEPDLPETRNQSFSPEEDCKSLVTAPLTVGKLRLGILTVCRFEQSAGFSETEAKLIEDIAGRTALAIQNVKLYQEIQDASRLKDEFLATVSHELRTPLNSILGWIQMMRTGKLEDEIVARALETIERNARSQSQLIDDLLDVSRIITGKLRLDLRPVELVSVIEMAIESVWLSAENKGIRLEKILDPGVGSISGDPERLQQVVWNLLSNAIKFTPKNGKVQVRLERINSHVEITVSDTGDGIIPEFLPHVFERFQQADGTKTRKYGGLGLGLAIVRHLTELHGGSVHVYSAGAGQGATFTIKLPLMIVRDAERFPSELSERKHPTAGDDFSFDLPEALKDLHILVVEDNADSRELLAAILQQYGAKISASENVVQAIELIENLKPDLLISDIEMPGKDGYFLIRHIRSLSNDSERTIPAIALTAHAKVEDRLLALTAGFDSHIAKPFEAAELIAVIVSLVKRYSIQS